MSRDEVKFITLQTYNQIAHTSYESVTELIYHPPAFDEELAIRAEILPSAYDMSTLIVVEVIPSTKIEIYLQTETYEDVRERLIPINPSAQNRP